MISYATDVARFPKAGMLRQSGRQTIHPTAILWERSMRILYGVQGEVSPPWLDTWTKDTATRRPTDEQAAAAVAPIGSPPKPDAPGTIRAAMSVLVTCIIEGFAVYATMYPCLTDAAEHLAPQARNSEAHSYPESEWVAIPRPLSADVRLLENAVQSQSQPADTDRRGGRPTSYVADFLRGIRRWRSERWAIVELERLDDRMLKDIGIHRCQIESIARHWDPYRL